MCKVVKTKEVGFDKKQLLQSIKYGIEYFYTLSLWEIGIYSLLIVPIVIFFYQNQLLLFLQLHIFPRKSQLQFLRIYWVTWNVFVIINMKKVCLPYELISERYKNALSSLRF